MTSAQKPLTRRTFIAAASLTTVSSARPAFPANAPSATEQLREIHTRIGGRLGVHALDTGSGRRIGYDDNSRDAMASTFKLLLAAAVLSRVDRGEIELEQRIAFDEDDMVFHAPVTSKHLTRGSMSVRELCAATVTVSDNPAANLLLPLIGGPPGFTSFVRALGDDVTRLDRFETELNSNLPGDPRDTTTPRAMVGSMEQVLTQNVLADSSRARLVDWLVESPSGRERIRAGVPPDWKAGDKSGSGDNGALNDIAITWPPGRKPLLIAVYLSESRLSAQELNAAHAEIGALLARELA